jgi:hypothetical protein
MIPQSSKLTLLVQSCHSCKLVFVSLGAGRLSTLFTVHGLRELYDLDLGPHNNL